ncbi:hypothetical protein SAY86_026670 [Trapa natans]|uniref:pectinesterase n=1 Tax=Trapa natans TaxID=22666 RepID=A0AAN7KLZ1_TRANT|nr:hypothetical protein SAY86_026670 [Trapa natans]
MAMTAHRRFIKAHRSPPTLLAVFSNCNFLIISMAAFLILCLLGFHFISFPFFSSADIRHHRTVSQNNIPTTPSHFAAPQDVQKACKATRFPDFCANSLSQYPRSVSDPSQILNSAISISADNLKTAQDMVRRILDSAAGKPGRNAAARNCLEVLDDSAYRIRSAVDALPRGKTKDARAWLSAALLYQYDCWSALKYANDTALVNETMSLLDSLTMLTSNSLGMLVSYDLYGSDVGSWRLPATERDGFWEPGPFSGSGQDFTAGFPANLAADVMVCKDEVGGCSYSKVQDAVDTAPSNGARRFVIRIRAGIYRETVRISLDKKNVVFVGDGVGKTIITGSLNVGQPGIWTYNTATVEIVNTSSSRTSATLYMEQQHSCQACIDTQWQA